MSDPRVTDKVVGVAFAAFTFDKFAHPVQAMRSALEAAVPLLAPQPAVDREAEGLEALRLDICRTFGAVESPSLDQLEGMLLKRGWVRREEVAQALEREKELIDSLPTDDPEVSPLARTTLLARASAFRDAAKITREINQR